MAWLVCLSAGLFFFYEFFQLNLFDVINQSLRDDFHIDAGQLSWMSSAYVWANILFLLPAGVLLDRFSVRRVILAAMLVCIVGTIGFGLTHSFLGAFVFHFLTGIGNAFCFLSCVVLAARWFPPRRQAFVIGCLVTMAFFGGMMAHTPMAFLNEHFGWRRAMMIDAAVGLVLFFWLLLIIKDRPSAVDVNESLGEEEHWSRAFGHALKNSQNWFCGLYTACLNLPIMVLGALWGASYLNTVHQLSTISASNVVSCLFVGSMVGCPLVGWISDAIGRRVAPMFVGGVLTILAFSPLFMGAELSNVSLGVIFFAIGFVTSAQVISYPCIAESNPPTNTGAATGIASVIIMGGGGVGQVIFGQLMQTHAGGMVASYSPQDFQFALWMFPVATILALLGLVLTRETFCQQPLIKE
jgi:MFS family permease